MIHGANDFDLLVIEDNPADMFLLVKMLNTSGLGIRSIHTADNIKEAQQLLSAHPAIRAVLLDLSLPDSFGLESYFAIRELVMHIPVIILTGQADASIAIEALKAGAQDYLVKGQYSKDLLSRSIQYSIERKQQAEKLKESEARYRYMFNHNPFPSFIIDLESLMILEVNDSASEKYQYSRDEFLKMSIRDICAHEDRDHLEHLLEHANKTGINRTKTRHRKKDGTILYVEVTFYEVAHFGKAAMQAQINDITDKIELENELIDQQKQEKRQITTAVLVAQEKERTMLGEELHDNINQIIVSAKLYLDLAAKKMKGPLAEMLNKSSNYMAMAIEEMRKLSRTLVKPSLGTNSLIPALADVMDMMKQVSPVKMKLVYKDLSEEDLSEEQQLAIYRIVQEQLNNIVKHAEADHVTIILDNTSTDQVILRIEDDGKGFDPSVRRKGVGITNINSRAEVLNGKVEIDTAPGQGCRLKVVFDNKNMHHAD